MRILKIAEQFEHDAEPLPETKDWLAPGSTASKYIKDMDDLWIHIVVSDEDRKKGMCSVFVNCVELVYCSESDAEHTKQLLERLMRERIIYREKALAGEKD